MRAYALLALLAVSGSLFGIYAFERIASTEVIDREVILRWVVEPFPWEFRTTNVRSSLNAQPGGTWNCDYALTVDLSRYEKSYGKFTELIVGVFGDWRYDQNGDYRSGANTYAVSSNFTTTGIPIERFNGWLNLKTLHEKDGSPFEAVAYHDLQGQPTKGMHRLSGTLTTTLPPDTPTGYYEPMVLVFVRVEGVKQPVHLAQYSLEWHENPPLRLPLVKVGSPSAPKLPWSILTEVKIAGKNGALPDDYKKKVELIGRSGFTTDLVLPPGKYPILPGFPTLFPQETLAPLDGGGQVLPAQMNNFLAANDNPIHCQISGPKGQVNFPSQHLVNINGLGGHLSGGGFEADLTVTGKYTIELNGKVSEAFGREFSGGGAYTVQIAHPLTFSTSCKPGTSFLVGEGYPAKVNVLPPFPAIIHVRVEYYPNSDPEKLRVWETEGHANRFGHFVPHDTPPIRFDQPGEYRSTVTAKFTDKRGERWMGRQVSAGVIAPQNPVLVLHGTRTFPYNNKTNEPFFGARKRYSNRQDLTTSFMPYTPSMLPDPYAPYDSSDTLFIPANGFNESLVEPHLSMDIRDPALKERLVEAYRRPSIAVPPAHQMKNRPWEYLHDVVQVSTDSFSWFSVDEPNLDELPVMPVGKDGWHPFAFPQKRIIEAYTYLGVVRPGFPVMTSAYQTDAIGLYWMASPNRFGNHYNTGPNGDLSGDVYRIQAGAVLKDMQTGKNYYDAYSAAIAVIASDGAANGILPPGEQPLIITNGREHRIFLAQDTHDVLEVGEGLGVGGMVFPNIVADVKWTITKPSGEKVLIEGRSNRLGIVRGRSFIRVDQPGIYKIEPVVQYKGMTGDLPGTNNGAFFHCAVPKDNPTILTTNIPARMQVDPKTGLRIRLSWPDDLRNPKITWGVLMPGRVLDQGSTAVATNSWEYPFEPIQLAAQFPNLDVRNFATGKWELADTLVFQLFFEAENDQGKVYDSVRLALRQDRLYNYQALMNIVP